MKDGEYLLKKRLDPIAVTVKGGMVFAEHGCIGHYADFSPEELVPLGTAEPGGRAFILLRPEDGHRGIIGAFSTLDLAEKARNSCYEAAELQILSFPLDDWEF